MRLVTNLFEAIQTGRVFYLHGGPHAGARVVFDGPFDSPVEINGARYTRTSCGYRFDPVVEHVAPVDAEPLDTE